MLIVKIVNDDMTAYGGFQWPSEIGATVTAPDWDPAPRCGGGLHGWARGEGAYRHGKGSRFVVFESDDDIIVSLGGGEKCKAQSGIVRYVGDAAGAVTMLRDAGALTAASNPTVELLGSDGMRQLAYRCATRAIQYRAQGLRSRGYPEWADKLAAIPPIVDRASAITARDLARKVRAYAYAAAADAAADAAAYAAAYAANAYAAAYAADAYAYAAEAAAADAADAYAYAYAAYAAADARAHEQELQRLDKLAILGIAP